MGSHTNVSRPSNMASIAERCSGLRSMCDICNFRRAYDIESAMPLLSAFYRTHTAVFTSVTGKGVAI